MTNKICPLMSCRITWPDDYGAKTTMMECYQDGCGWYDTERGVCSIVTIANMSYLGFKNEKDTPQ